MFRKVVQQLSSNLQKTAPNNLNKILTPEITHINKSTNIYTPILPNSTRLLLNKFSQRNYTTITSHSHTTQPTLNKFYKKNHNQYRHYSGYEDGTGDFLLGARLKIAALLSSLGLLAYLENSERFNRRKLFDNAMEEILGLTANEQIAVRNILAIHNKFYRRTEGIIPSSENARRWLLETLETIKKKTSDNSLLEMSEENKAKLAEAAHHIDPETTKYEHNVAFYKKTITDICQIVKTRNDEYIANQNRLTISPSK